ncbi:MAG: PAS domain S-box protein, partial [Planctomycetes bacterium]|nr:PAS domain S-box protein [Planctomycetota bacterium]
MKQGKPPDNQIEDTFPIRQAVEGMQDALHLSDLRTGELTYFNRAFVDISGLSAEEICTLQVGELRARIHPEDREEYLARIDDLVEAARRTGAPQSEDLEYRWLHKDGTYHWFSSSRTLLLDEQGQPKVLVSVLRDVTRQKETERALLESERLLREVLENSRDALYRHNLRTGTFDYFSPAIEALTGYTAEELIEMTAQGAQDLVHPDDLPAYLAHTQALLASADSAPVDTVDYRWKTKEGVYRWFSNSRRLVRDETGQPVALVGTLRDITDQKEAETEREEALHWLGIQRAQMQTVFDQLPVGLILAEAPSGKLILANQQVPRILRQPFPLFSEVSEYNSNLGFHPDGRPYAPEEWPLARAVRRGEEVHNEEIDILRGDGTRGVISTSAVPIRDEQGQVVAGVVVIDDITERKKAEAERERLMVEQDRERSLLETIMENTPAELAYLDRDFRFVRVNSAYARDARYSPEQLIGRNHFDLFPNAENQAIFERVRDTGEPVRFEAKPFVDVHQPEKGVTYWDWSLIPIKGAEGQVEGFVFSLLNVTEHERLLSEIEQRAAELNATIGSINDGLVLYGPNGEFRHMNQAGERILGITSEEWASLPKGKRAERLQAESPDGRPLDYAEFPSSHALHGETVTNYHMVTHRPDGACVDLLISAAPIRNAQGEIIGAVTTFSDITRLINLQEEVQTERARLQAVLEALPVGVFLADPSGRLTLTNRVANDIWGHAPLSKSWDEYSSDYKAWWPDTGQQVQSHEWPLTRAVEYGEVSGAEEMEIETQDGERKTILNYALPVRDVSGALIGGVEVDVDITDRKQAEQVLERYRLLSENARDIILFINPDGCIVEANLAAERAYGYSRDELLTKTVYDLRAEPAAPLVNEQIAQANAEGITFETAHRHRDGSAFPVEVSSRGTTIGGQRVLLSIIRDITDRKQAEQALRESEERFATAFRANPNGLVITRVEDGTILDVNDAFLDLFQWTREEVIGRTTRALNMYMHPEQRDEIVRLLQQDGRLRDYEVHIRRK